MHMSSPLRTQTQIHSFSPTIIPSDKPTNKLAETTNSLSYVSDVSKLIEILNDPKSGSLVYRAVKRLEELATEPARDALTQLLGIRHSLGVRAMESLSRIGHPSSLPHLMRLLDKPRYCSSAPGCVANFGSQALPLLFQSLQVGPPVLRQKSAETVGLIGDRSGFIPLLFSFRNDSEPRVR